MTQEDEYVTLAQEFCDDVFPSVWEDMKDELKDLSKKESCEELFFAGALEMLYFLLDQENDLGKNAK